MPKKTDRPGTSFFKIGDSQNRKNKVTLKSHELWHRPASIAKTAQSGFPPLKKGAL
jgi:hypothetical protein